MKFCTVPNFHLTDLSLYHIILCPDLRRGCENALRHPGSYPGDLHAGHLHPHHRRYAETSGGDRGGIPGRHFRRGAETVGRKRKNGEGTVRLRKDGRWEGRVVIGYDDKGLPKTKNVLAKTKSECVEKLKTLKDALAQRAFSTRGPNDTGVALTYLFTALLKMFFGWRRAYRRPTAATRRPSRHAADLRRLSPAVHQPRTGSYPAEQADREGYAAVLRLAENGGACGPIGR